MSDKPGWLRRLLSAPVILLVSLVTVTLLHLPLAVFPMGRDQGVWATAGFAMNNGAVFFKDYLHFNLPGLGFSYALAFKFVDDPRAASMLVSLAGSILIMLGIYLLLRQTVNKTAAAWSVLLFSVIWPTYIDSWGIAQKDFMAMYGVLFSTWLMSRADQPAKWRRLSIYAAGVAVGLAIMYKPLFAITGLLLAAVHTANFALSPATADNCPKKQYKKLTCDLSLLLAGALTVALLFLYYIFSGNALEGLYQGLFVFAPAYSGISSQPVLQQLNVLLGNTAIIAQPLDWSALIHYLLWTPVILFGLAMLAKHAWAKEKAWLFVPFLTALFTYLIQGKAFSYHAIPWQICMFIAAGYCLDQIRSSCKTLHRRKIVSVLIAAGVCMIFARALLMTHYAQAEVPAWLGIISRQEYLRNSFPDINPSFGIPSPAVSENLAQWLQENSPPEEKILVWGLECQIYVLANRMFATHCPFDFLLTADLKGNEKASAWQQRIRQEFMQQLAAEKPKFILVVSGDFSPVEPVPSKAAAALVPGFQTFIDSQYHKVKSVELFDVYQRNL